MTAGDRILVDVFWKSSAVMVHHCTSVKMMRYPRAVRFRAELRALLEMDVQMLERGMARQRSDLLLVVLLAGFGGWIGIPAGEPSLQYLRYLCTPA